MRQSVHRGHPRDVAVMNRRQGTTKPTCFHASPGDLLDARAAAETLKTGFAMSRHAAEGGALINSMVGVAVASVLVPEVEHLVQADDFPNLYWALSALGSPLIDIATPIDHERLWIFSEFPYSSKLSTTILSKAQAQDLKASATKFLDFVNGSGTDSVLPNELKVAAYSMLAYPEAKAALVERGYDVEKVELMPVAQVIVLNGLEHYASFLDESVVIARLPYF